ncbi:MAG: calcium/sodium antiporter [Phycisphaerae bacterium]|nr:calcium/sodium antiporter [Phycisphaerae bacterium]NIP52056.1 calcium/sodium antiporter [Phycisphaerae bacterium]NIS50021.1 calcium/sodium antiporter [Phycisphaerae bacterium]NIU10276.1 calcium/sodium antiporter [Phycisphaerae bacterium]NIU55287.1 calcium/sodium antiporter [Phycisphaerae bacterium]
MSYVLLIIGFVLLIKGASFLVDGAASLGRRLNVSDLVIGLTVVAFGTSTPELFVNIFASIKGNTDIAIGNILGSNIANIFLILGISAVIFPLAVRKGTVWKEIPLSLLAALLLGVMANDRLIDKSSVSVLTRIDGIVFISFFIIFIYYSVSIAKRIEGIDEQLSRKQYGLLKSFLLTIGGLIGLGIGGNLIVDSAAYIASKLGISESLIGLTVVAVGTSLPELATSAVAAYKKNVEIAVGNVVGSNIFNIFFVLGLSSIIKPLPFQAGGNIDISVVILASLLLFICMFTGKKHSLDRWEGIVLIILYCSYIAFLIIKK